MSGWIYKTHPPPNAHCRCVPCVGPWCIIIQYSSRHFPSRLALSQIGRLSIAVIRRHLKLVKMSTAMALRLTISDWSALNFGHPQTWKSQNLESGVCEKNSHPTSKLRSKAPAPQNFNVATCRSMSGIGLRKKQPSLRQRLMSSRSTLKFGVRGKTLLPVLLQSDGCFFRRHR